jgi:hypothetical protein
MWPSQKCILKLYNKWWKAGSVLDKQLFLKHVVTERLKDVRVRMEIIPWKSSHWLAEECNLSKSSALICLKGQKLHPYKVSVVQKLNPVAPVAHVNFCQTLQSVHDGIVNVIFFHEWWGWVSFNGFVNDQNTHHLDSKNLQAVHKVPLDDKNCVCVVWLVVVE